MANRTAAIMQPTHLPWLGYFDLMDQSDYFLFLDSVQFSKRSWQQRNRVKTSNGAQWLTVPVLTKGKREQPISEVEMDLDSEFHLKHLKTIHNLYGKASYFGEYIGGISDILNKGHRLLGDLNIELIIWFCEKLGVKTPTERTSNLNVDGSKADLLISVCQAASVNRYLSAEGSRTYIEEDNQFGAHGIELVYQNYVHPEYRQLNGEFVPYLSVLDLLFNEGPGSLEIIRAGREQS